MTGIKYTRFVLLSLIFIIPVLALFPTPQFVSLESTPLRLSSENNCASFQLHIASDHVLAFMPHSADKNL